MKAGFTMTDQNWKEAQDFWEKKDAEKKAMPPETLKTELDKFLNAHKICALATGDGEDIRSTPLEYSWFDGALWIFSEGGRKFKGLQENQNVSAAVFEPNEKFGSLKSVQIFGTAEVLGPEADEYKTAARQRHIPLKVLQKLPDPMWLIKITPAQMVFLNSAFKLKGYGSRQTYHS